MDLLLAGNDEGHLYLNDGDATYIHQQSFAGTDGYMGGFADLDNDGDLDLYFAGDTKVYLNDGAARFTAGPTVPVVGRSDPRGVAFADFDGDGDLDFAIGDKRAKRNYLIRNDLANGGSWLKVKLVSVQGQAGAFGAITTVYPAGESTRIGVRESQSNSGYLGQNDSVLHFGLGDHEVVDLEVRFLDGSVVKRSGIRASQTVLIRGVKGQ